MKAHLILCFVYYFITKHYIAAREQYGIFIENILNAVNNEKGGYNISPLLDTPNLAAYNYLINYKKQRGGKCFYEVCV